MEDAAPSLPKIRFRRLRIAWSVLAAGACICVVALWVRSFTVSESLLVLPDDGRYFLKLWSMRGGLLIDFGTDPPGSGPAPFFCRLFQSKQNPADFHNPPNILGFRFVRGNPNRGNVPYNKDDFQRIPYWFCLLIAAAIGAVPWIRIRWSFSLRTMLIAVTLIAALIGFARLATFTYPA